MMENPNTEIITAAIQILQYNLEVGQQKAQMLKQHEDMDLDDMENEICHVEKIFDSCQELVKTIKLQLEL